MYLYHKIMFIIEHHNSVMMFPRLTRYNIGFKLYTLHDRSKHVWGSGLSNVLRLGLEADMKVTHFFPLVDR